MKEIISIVLLGLLMLMMLGVTPMILFVAYDVVRDVWGKRKGDKFLNAQFYDRNEARILKKLNEIRVLRTSCPDSIEGEFRVHLPEKDWDEIVALLKKINEAEKNL